MMASALIADANNRQAELEVDDRPHSLILRNDAVLTAEHRSLVNR